MIMKTIKEMEQYIRSLHRVAVSGYVLMKELAGNDVEKMKRVNEWRDTTLAMIETGLPSMHTKEKQ
jgi:hypothetical protein